MTNNQGKIITQATQQANDKMSDTNIFEQFVNTNPTTFENITSQVKNNNKNTNNNNNANTEFSVFNYNYYNNDDIYESDSPEEKSDNKNTNSNNNNNNGNNNNRNNNQESGNQMSMRLISEQKIQFIGQTEIVPISHDTVTLNRIYSLAEYRRNEYLETITCQITCI